MKFGNLVTYTGKYLSTAKKKAENGNLVFAKITGCDASDANAEEESIVDGVTIKNKDAKGYYIYAGGAQALLVTKDDFVALKNEVVDLQKKVGTFDEVDVPAYVTARIEALKLGEASKLGVAKTINDKDHASDELLATEKAVRTAVDEAIAAIPEVPVKDVTLNDTSVVGKDGVAAFKADYIVTKGSTNLVTSGAVEAAISSLGDVMSFIGVVSAVPADDNVTLTNGDTVKAGKGDVITIASTDSKSGTEYVWTGTAWVEIGRVAVDEAVTSLGNVKGDITLGGALEVKDQALDVKLAAEQGNVTLDTTDGLKASVLAKDIAYVGEKLDGDDKAATTTATNVKDALDDLFRSDRTTAESLVDLNTRLTVAEGDIADLKAGLDAVEHTTVSAGKDDDFINVSESTEGSHKNYAVSADVVRSTKEGYTNNGLATDAYVKETVDTALTWEVLTDDPVKE